MAVLLGLVVLVAGGVAGYVCLPVYHASIVVWGITAVVLGLVGISDQLASWERWHRRRDKELRQLLFDIMFISGGEAGWTDVMERRGIPWDRHIPAPEIDKPIPRPSAETHEEALRAEMNGPPSRVVTPRMGVGARLLLVLVVLALTVVGTLFVARITTGQAPRFGSAPTLPASRP